LFGVSKEDRMLTIEEVGKQSLEQRLDRMSRTADDLAGELRGQTEAVLVRRPDGKNWAANEVICHLRDIEEVYFVRFHAMLANDDPKLYADPSAADRFAEDRQYLRNDAVQALASFRRRREESLALLRTLTPEQLQRGCLHPSRGRITIDGIVTMLAWHDDNHLDQLRRALDGKV
jgi:DinB family protein